MIKAYCVAGHTFHLVMPDSHRLWSCLDQYAPFLAEPVEDPVFTLRMVEDLPEGDMTPVYTTEGDEEGMPRLDMFELGAGGYIVDMAPILSAPTSGRLHIAAGYKDAGLKILKEGRNASLFSLNNSLMLMFAFSTADKMTLEMHSSVVSNGGKGYLFLGKSGSGKSTHSSLWLKYIEGSSLMNDDNPVLKVEDDGTIMIYGSPWSGKTPCYRNVQAPVGALVLIRQAPYNKITRQGLLESYATVYSSCSGFKADLAMGDSLHRTLEKVVLGVPCYTLECLPDEDAAKVCSREVKGEVANG